MVLFLYEENMADNEITQKIIDTLNGVAHEFGKMTSPTAGIDTKGKSKKGKSYEGFTFGISARMDGDVQVYGKNFIRISWQSGNYRDSKICKSLNEAEAWFRSNEWTGNDDDVAF